jgi:hypothetical protein
MAIIIKNSSTSGVVPTAAQLELGELAINTADGKLFAEKGDGTVVELSYRDDRARAAISVTKVSGEGDISYDNSTGVISYTGPTAGTSLTIGKIDTAGTLSGEISGVNAIRFDTDSGFDVVDLGSGAVKILMNSTFKTWQVAGQTSLVASGLDTVEFVAGSGMTITTNASASPKSISFASSITQYTDSDARAAISVTDAGGDGSLSYDSSTGVITYTGPSASEVRAHFTAGTGVTITSGSIAIGQPVATTDNVTFNNLTVSGDLTVNGTTTTINSTTISVDDKNIVLGDVATPTDTTADGGGITLKGATDKTFNWIDATDAWTSSEHLALAAGKNLLLNGSTSGTITLSAAAIAGTNTITFPATTGTVVTTGDTGSVTSTMIEDGTIVNADVNASAAIAYSKLNLTDGIVNADVNASAAIAYSKLNLTGSIVNADISTTAAIEVSKLAANTISGVTLGNNLNALTIGTGLSGTSYNGSTGITIAIDNTVVTTDGVQTLTNKTLQDSTTYFADDGDATKKLQFQLSGITTGTTRTLTIQDSSGTVALTSNKLSDFSATTSAELASVISDETGSGALVFANSPSLITPILGVASATSINKLAITEPATGSTLTIADGKTLTASNTLTFTGTDGSSVAFGTGGTVAYTSNKLSDFAATTSAELASVISDETGSGALVFANSPTLTGTVNAAGISTSGNVIVGGNLTVSGTTTTVNSTVSTIVDPIIDIGGSTGGAAPVTDDNKDRGISFQWHNGSTAKIGFFGFDDSTGKFIFVPDASISSEVVSGTLGTIDVGAVHINGSQISAANLSNGTTGSGAIVLATSPTLVTPTLGVASATSINKVSITAPATGSTLTIADGKTLTASNTLTFTGTDGSSVAFGTGGTVVYTSNKLSALSATTSAELAGVISDETGSGALVFANSPSLTTPTIGGGGLNLSGSTSGSLNLKATSTAGSGVIVTIPATTGTLVTTGDTGTVTSTMIADGTIVNSDINASAAIAVSKLAASTISGITLGNNLATLTIGTGLSGTSYNGSTAVTIANSGVTSITAGSGISVSAGTGSVTISATGGGGSSSSANAYSMFLS